MIYFVRLYDIIMKYVIDVYFFVVNCIIVIFVYEKNKKLFFLYENMFIFFYIFY